MRIFAKIIYCVNSSTGSVHKHSTELATIKLVDYLLKQMDDNQIPCAIYLDLSKSFDTHNFDIVV